MKKTLLFLQFFCTLLANISAQTKITNPIDQLKKQPFNKQAANKTIMDGKGNWEENVQQYIRESEYFFKQFDDKYATVNRKQQIAFTATGTKFITNPIQYNSENSKMPWTSSLEVIHVGKNRDAELDLAGAMVISEKNYLLYKYPGFKIEYLNNEKGLRQNFIVDTKPKGDEKLQVSLKISGTLMPSILDNKLLVLKDEKTSKIILKYDDLKVWDAHQRLLPASMEISNGNELTLVVDDADAVYPVTVDPLTHAAEWTTSADGVLPGLLNTLQLQIDALYGYNVAALGDINDDGFDDIAIGAPGAIDIIAGPTTVVGAGAVFVFFGSATGPSTTPDKVLRATTPIVNALFGFSVAGGNVTATVPGNLRNDIIVGAPGESYTTSVSGLPTTATVTAGKVYVFSGETMSGVGNPSPLLSVFLNGSTYFSNGVFGLLSANVSVNALFGFSVAASEDMNGDGLGEVIVGSPGYAAPGILPLLPVRVGTALVYYSTNLATNTPTQLVAPTASLLGIPLITNGLLFGFSVDGLGDYDMDGKPDVVVGAPAGLNLVPPTNLLGGTAYIYKGTGSGVNPNHYAHLRDTSALINNIANLFGYSVRGVRDANGVRNGNVLVGAPSGHVLSNLIGGLRLKTGTVNVFLKDSTPASGGQIPNQSITSPRGNSLLSILFGQNLSVSALFGVSIDNMLDVNCDGINDIIVGEPLSTGVGLINADAVGGAVNIFLGKADGTYQTSTFWSLQNNTDFPFGINAGSLLGYSVAGARHVRGASNGVRALVGAPGAALDFSSGVFNLGATFGTLFSFVAGNNGLGKAYLYGFDDCGLMLNPDINATWVNVPVPGSVKTNDAVPALTAYGTPVANVGNPVGGAITMNANGTYSFTSTTAGVFYYQVPVCISGQSMPCPTTELKISVLDQSSLTNPPVANTDIATTKAGNPVTLNSLSNDKCSNAGCSLNTSSVLVTINPANGVAVVDPGTGNITYTPNPGFTGKDTLTYQVCDIGVPIGCAIAQQIITVNAIAAVNATNAADDYMYTQQGIPVSGNVKLNDTDPENDDQDVTSQTTTIPGAGTLTLNADGSFDFVPLPTFSGPVDFAYTTCDNATPQACASATLHILVNDGGPLPITITNFAASSKNCGVTVQWNYSNQVSGDYTELEQSFNGTTFTPVYRINFNGQSAGSNNIKIAQLQGKGYYRLKITDYDGRFHYSDVEFVQVNCGEQEKLQVFPTLLTTTTQVIFNTSEAKGPAVLTLVDVYGRRIIQQQVNIVKGTNRMIINGKSLASGAYFVSIAGNGWKSETVKVIKE